MSGASEDRGLLCVGDEFALQTVPNAADEVGFVSVLEADGSVFCDVLKQLGPDMSNTHPPHPADAVFALHTAKQYGASKELRKFTERVGSDPERRKRLQANVEAEEDVNDMELELARGQPACFGGIYQLQNPGCNQYIQTQKTLATDEKAAVQCRLAPNDVDNRSKSPWFKILPGFRTRNEGEQVRMGDTVVLLSMKMPGMYVHLRMPNDGQSQGKQNAAVSQEATREVNIFEEYTRFKIVPIAKVPTLATMARYNGTAEFQSILQGLSAWFASLRTPPRGRRGWSVLAASMNCTSGSRRLTSTTRRMAQPCCTALQLRLMKPRPCEDFPPPKHRLGCQRMACTCHWRSLQPHQNSLLTRRAHRCP